MSGHAGPKLAATQPLTSFDFNNRKMYTGIGTSVTGLGISSESGTLIGSPTYNSGSITLNGTGQYVDCGTNKITGSSAFSLAAWFKTTLVNRHSGIISIGTSVAGASAYIGTVGVAQLGTSNSIGGGFYGTNIGTGVTTTNQWLYLVMTYAGGTNGTVTFYINGSNVYSVASGITPNISSSSYKIGRIGTDSVYDLSGSIGITRVFNTVLSATEVRKNFNATRGRYGI